VACLGNRSRAIVKMQLHEWQNPSFLFLFFFRTGTDERDDPTLSYSCSKSEQHHGQLLPESFLLVVDDN